MNYLDFIIIGVFSLGFLFLGYLFKNQNDKKDYFLGGRSFGWFPLSMSVMATQLSAISFISAPAFVGLREGGGMHWLGYEFAVPLAMVFIGTWLVPYLYKSGVVSIYEFLEQRFNRTTRILISIVFQVSRAFATGIMIYAVALILMAVLGIPMWGSILAIGLITIIYSYQGGMKAVVFGDMIQMIILFGGIILCLIYGLDYVGGWDSFTQKVDAERLSAVDFESLGFSQGQEFGFWPLLIGGFFLYASYYGTDQSQVQRLLSAKNVKVAQKTLFYNGILRFPLTFSYCLMGLVIGTFAISETGFISQIPADKPDLMIPIFIRDYLPNGVIGLLIVAILSAAMSSLSSAINSLSAATTEDIIIKGFKIDESRQLSISRYSSLGWGVVCIILAFFAGNIASTVIEAINKVGSVFFGPVLATFLIAIWSKKTLAQHMNLGILSGVGVNVFLWLVVGDNIFWFWWNFIGAFVTWFVSSLLALKSKATESIKTEVVWNKSYWILGVWFILIVVVSYLIESILS